MNDTTDASFLLKPAAALAIALGACLPMQSNAQSMAGEGPWRFGGSIYGYIPSIGGSSSLPVDSGGGPIDVDASKVLDKLKFAFLGAFDAHNGRWGVFTDVIYVNFGEDRSQTRDFTIGNAGIPAGTSADFNSSLKALFWTAAGQYRLVSDPSLTVDALGGLRLFEMRQTIHWNISGNLGSIAPAGRTGESNVKFSNWDAIAGVKGRYAFADRWSVPFYADIGTGESDLTYQAAAGVSYRFSWGEITGLWRYLDYDMKSGKVINKINFNGPMIGATFRW